MLRVQSFLSAVALLTYFGGVALMPTGTTPTIGFQRLRIDDSRGTPIDLAIWYPSRSRASLHRSGSISQTVAVNGAVEGRDHPLVIIAPRGGSSFSAHHHTASSLAGAGYVVAIPSQSDRASFPRFRPASLLDGVERISVAIDFMNVSWSGASAIDAGRLGAVGFSSGGFAVLVAIGGTPDLRQAGPGCEIDGAYATCNTVPSFGGYEPGMRKPSPLPASDRRIAAVALVAPTMGFTFSADGLERVVVPVQLWRLADDAVAPHPWHADLIQRNLLRPADYHVVANAGHCTLNSPGLDGGLAIEGACPAVADAAQRDLLDAFNNELTAFFDRKLRVTRR